jgi:hypothetical protein
MGFMAALYERQDEHFVPRPEAAGPWMEATQNGGAVGALLATIAEASGEGAGWVPMALNIEILRPIPMVPLRPTVAVLRDGRRLQILRVMLAALQTEVATATLVRLRPVDNSLCGPSNVGDYREPPPTWWRKRSGAPFFSIVDCRLGGGSFHQQGPASAWMRMMAEVIAGSPASALAAAALMADAGSGLSCAENMADWSFPNVTLSLHMHRPIVGEWLHLRSETRSAGGGIAQVNTVHSDGTGEVGHAHQLLCLAARHAVPSP